MSYLRFRSHTRPTVAKDGTTVISTRDDLWDEVDDTWAIINGGTGDNGARAQGISITGAIDTADLRLVSESGTVTDDFAYCEVAKGATLAVASVVATSDQVDTDSLPVFPTGLDTGDSIDSVAPLTRFTFPSPYTASPGDSLWLIVRRVKTSTSPRVDWRTFGSDHYADGGAWRLNSSSVWVEITDFDYEFVVSAS